MPARPSRSSKSRNTLRQLLGNLIGPSGSVSSETQRGRLLLETLEQRQLMAGDMDLLFTDGAGDSSSDQAFQTGSQLNFQSTGEGEAQPDLAQFAKDLDTLGVTFYGAHWCPACTQQKELFADGKNYLPFEEVTNPDRSFNSTATALSISQIPTWDFPSGARLVGVQTLEAISQAAGIPIPTSDQPSFKEVGPVTVRTGSPLHIPIDAYDPGDGPLTTTVTVTNPAILEATVLTGNRSLRLDMTGYGDMVFELFEQRAPIASGRVAELANEGFYDGIIFHRVVDNFVIQAGDPTGTGTSGSTKANFDDDFHPDLQHNTEGVLSFAKTTDDTNNSQFFITEIPTRNLDFNHSVFGQLVEGFDVREAISETQVNNSSQNKPTNAVTIESASVFTDTENSVVMLKPIGNATGTTTVTVTVTDADGNSFSETITVTIAADTANSQPFLNPIADPQATPVGQQAQLQLSSTDIEGDAVTYTAASSSSNATAVVNSTTGLVTVTPVAGFAGTVSVQVGVQPGPGVTGNGQSDSDLQTVAFTFESEGVLTPTAVDLQTGSDTGTSNVDNITRAGSLTFQVSGVATGQTIELVNTATGSIIGTGTATGSTITITTNNISALDGTYLIAARSRLGNDVSNLSPSLTVVFDTTAPTSVIASAPRTANVDRPYIADLISPEESSGLVYQLTASPTGASIDATTGVITWTPASNQLGANPFTVLQTDVAGNLRTESFDVTASGQPLAEIKLEATDLQGNVIDSLAVGQEFLLNLIGVDARSFVQPGIFAAYADILFDSTLVQPVAGSTIDYSDDFTVVPKGVFSTGLIDELGAVINRTVATDQKESLVATVRMKALASGTVNIISEPADDSNSETLLFGNDNQIPAESIAYGNVTLAIGQSFTVNDDTFTVVEDSGAIGIDVLANDTIVSGSGQLSVVSVTQPTSGGTVSLAGGAVLFTPAANFFGDAVFTYRVSGSGGIQEDGSVTVTVTPVNDPPTGVADTISVDQDTTNNTLDVLTNDSISPDTGESLTITAVGTPSAGGTVTISSAGTSLVYTPASGFIGNDTFTYTVSDGTLTSQVSVTVNVVTTDNPPTAVDDAFSIAEDAAEASFDVLTNDTRDTDNQTFTLNSVGTPTQGGTARISSDGTQFFYAPAADFNGSEEVTYTIRDTGGGVSIGTATFTVAAVNDPPPADDITVNSNRGDGEIVALTIDAAANVDSGETLTVSTFDSATTQGGTVRVDTASGRLFYTPPAGTFTGTDTFTYTISDGNGLTATGTVTIEVSDFTKRTISYQMVRISPSVNASVVRLQGTDALGNTVDQSSVINGDSLDFTNILPGNYSIEIPAIPFLQNGGQPTSIAISSLPTDGDTTIEGTLGRLRPEFISIRDFLRSTPRQSILVAVAPGESSLMAAPSSSTSTVESPLVELNEAGNSLTISGTRFNSTDSQDEDVTATVSTVANQSVQKRGEINGVRLYKISVESTDVTFTPITVSTATASTASSPSQAAASALAFDDSSAEGESVAAESVVAESVVQADVFSPASAVAASSLVSRELVLNTDDADVWSDQPATDLSAEDDLVSVESSTDVAMQSVTDELSLRSTTEDTLAAPATVNELNVDDLLSDNQS